MLVEIDLGRIATRRRCIPTGENGAARRRAERTWAMRVSKGNPCLRQLIHVRSAGLRVPEWTNPVTQVIRREDDDVGAFACEHRCRTDEGQNC